MCYMSNKEKLSCFLITPLTNILLNGLRLQSNLPPLHATKNQGLCNLTDNAYLSQVFVMNFSISSAPPLVSGFDSEIFKKRRAGGFNGCVKQKKLLASQKRTERIIESMILCQRECWGVSDYWFFHDSFCDGHIISSLLIFKPHSSEDIWRLMAHLVLRIAIFKGKVNFCCCESLNPLLSSQEELEGMK